MQRVLGDQSHVAPVGSQCLGHPALYGIQKRNRRSTSFVGHRDWTGQQIVEMAPMIIRIENNDVRLGNSCPLCCRERIALIDIKDQPSRQIGGIGLNVGEPFGHLTRTSRHHRTNDIDAPHHLRQEDFEKLSGILGRWILVAQEHKKPPPILARSLGAFAVGLTLTGRCEHQANRKKLSEPESNIHPDMARRIFKFHQTTSFLASSTGQI
jgi:hypothetical protein